MNVPGSAGGAPDRDLDRAPAIDIVMDAQGWRDLAGVLERVERAARAVLEQCADLSGRPLEMAVTLTDDARIQVLNRTWRGKDKPTNVLSFPAADVPPEVSPEPLGDVIIALETVLREAGEEHKAPLDHLSHLVVHGTLHLLGYDHEQDDEAEEMEQTERLILDSLGIADPYALPAET